ncbi:hypothetical protein [Paenibacillus wenxiniae]|uniref:N-terminal domain of peptidoglycan hydrolase CwlO-containing protein n=1 Tax=Paenibacillus wenxiniae TaxID=1636843 RepID=A0ABW4RGG8_9BACL
MKLFKRQLHIGCLLLTAIVLLAETMQPLHVSATNRTATSSQQAPSIENLNEQTRQLLENSLSAQELDHEIARVGAKQQAARQQYNGLQQELIIQQKQLDAARTQSDRVLVAYYTGERDQLWLALLNTGSLSGMITFYEYYQMIIDHDHDIMTSYQKQYNEMLNKQQQLDRTSNELQQIGANLKQQKQRVAQLHQQIDSGVASSSNPAIVRQLMQEMNTYWENIGLYEVRGYFNSLAQSMNQFPSFLKSEPDAIQIRGRRYTITIAEQQLNQFLHQQGGLPESFQFHFTEQGIVVNGQEGNLNLVIDGSYIVEDQPQNAIRFQVDKLIFNGLQLPDTTAKQLENQFDLGFYPGQIISYLKAKSVHMSNGQMQIELELSL